MFHSVELARSIILKAMKRITLSIPDEYYDFFLKLVKRLKFVKIVDENTLIAEGPTKQEFLEGIGQAVADVKMIKSGKMQAGMLNEMLDDL